MAKKRTTSKLSKTAADLVARERVCRVATANAEGLPHLVPVCHVLAGNKIYIGSGDEGAKVRNLMANPRITVTIDLYSEHWASLKGVMVQGRAKLIERGPAFQRARRRLYQKYPQYAREAAISPSDSVIIEITPTHVFTWGLD
jgi:nitroimidazol reductase NimA-like FMN-containing flavoprotein (pyridoxamine 5'-phosphate oxidase superfamily)